MVRAMDGWRHVRGILQVSEHGLPDNRQETDTFPAVVMTRETLQLEKTLFSRHVLFQILNFGGRGVPRPGTFLALAWPHQTTSSI